MHCSYQEYTAKETTMNLGQPVLRVPTRDDARFATRPNQAVVDFTSRLAVPADVAALTWLMDRAIAELQRVFLNEAQIASSRAIMGIDTQLIDDGTYFVVESGADVAGCGGWSRRATLYGGNHTPGRDGQLLDPTVDAARVRAMYTNPAFARRGVGRLILSLCEAAAATEGFTRLELMSTLSGEPLYTAYGFRPLERLEDSTGGVPVPLVRMEKPVEPSLLR
jgi:GNAT superfamily N-acetyltransferase